MSRLEVHDRMFVNPIVWSLQEDRHRLRVSREIYGGINLHLRCNASSKPDQLPEAESCVERVADIRAGVWGCIKTK